MITRNHSIYGLFCHQWRTKGACNHSCKFLSCSYSPKLKKSYVCFTDVDQRKNWQELFLELSKSRMFTTAAEETVENKTFSFLPRSAGQQPAHRNPSTTWDPFTCASRQSGTRKPCAHKETLKWNKALTSSKEHLVTLLPLSPRFTDVRCSPKHIALWVFLVESEFLLNIPHCTLLKKLQKVKGSSYHTRSLRL